MAALRAGEPGGTWRTRLHHGTPLHARRTPRGERGAGGIDPAGARAVGRAHADVAVEVGGVGRSGSRAYTGGDAMLFMVIERFRDNDMVPVYRRSEEHTSELQSLR